jgi:uncharacterized RDD family membrane protein YckC
MMSVMRRRRLLAVLVDYCVVLAWLIVLAAVFVPLYLAGLRPFDRYADLVAFLFSVLPVWLYLTVTESRPAAATWGKRRAGLHIAGPHGKRATTGRVAGRNAVKLLPWQLAHLGVAGFLADASVIGSALAWIPITATYLLVGVTVALALIRRDGAALHDLIAGTRVVRAAD